MTIKNISGFVHDPSEFEASVKVIDGLQTVAEVCPELAAEAFDSPYNDVSQTFYDSFKRPLGRLVITASDKINIYGELEMTSAAEEYGVLEAHMGISDGSSYTCEDRFPVKIAREHVSKDELSVVVNDDPGVEFDIFNPESYAINFS